MTIADHASPIVIPVRHLDMVTFALKTWKNKVKMYKVVGIQCPTPAP